MWRFRKDFFPLPFDGFLRSTPLFSLRSWAQTFFIVSANLFSRERKLFFS